MVCPYCHFPSSPLTKLTLLGYLRYECNSCHRTFNERTGTVFNFLEFPTDIVFQVLIVMARNFPPLRRPDFSN
jgi:putative transposase